LLFGTFDFERKKGSRIFLSHWSTNKNLKFPKNIEKKPYRRFTQKRYYFAPGVANNTFFTHPVLYLIRRELSFFLLNHLNKNPYIKPSVPKYQ